MSFGYSFDFLLGTAVSPLHKFVTCLLEPITEQCFHSELKRANVALHRAVFVAVLLTRHTASVGSPHTRIKSKRDFGKAVLRYGH